MMERKVYEAQIKQVTDTGKGTAILARLGVVDKDGDILEPGLLGGEPQTVPLVQSHDWQVPSFGRAVVRERGGELAADIELNLQTARGREWHEVLKFDLQRGPIQEWSFGFSVDPNGSEVRTLEDGRRARTLKRIRLLEVSPVVAGASVGSRTVALKADSPLDQATLAAMHERIRTMTLSPLTRPFPGDCAYKILRHNDAREVRNVAVALMGEACDQLGTSMAASVELFRPARDGEPVDFHGDPGIGGYAYVKSRKIFLSYDLRGADLARVVGHEAFHIAHPDGSEQEAETFGTAFSAKMLAGPRPGVGFTAEQLGVFARVIQAGLPIPR